MKSQDLTATTGIDSLDLAIEGLFWGDSVLWELEEGASVEPFYRAVASVASDYHYAAAVTMTAEPSAVATVYPNLDVLDARPGSPASSAASVLQLIESRCHTFDRDLLLFDSLDAILAAWGPNEAADFLTAACSLMLDLGAVAYWSVSSGRSRGPLEQPLRQATQCVLTLSRDRLRVTKAEGRGTSVEGRIFRYEVDEDAIRLDPAPVLARVGEALRSVRAELGLTQNDVARLAGITSSAVSQAERGHRGLSLETVLELTDRLGVGVDDFLRGKLRPGYRLGRHQDPRERGGGRPVSLLEDERSGYNVRSVYLPPNGTASVDDTHGGTDLVTVASGLVQVVLGSASPVLRQGEALLVEENETVYAWRNLCDRDALLFWIVRDPGITETGSQPVG